MSEYRAFIPTNCKFHVLGETIKQIELANSILYFLGFETVMGEILSRDLEVSDFTRNGFHPETGFLEVPVTGGDMQTRRAMMKAEVKRSLAVLRFVCPAQVIFGELRNPAKDIDVQASPYRNALYVELSDAGFWNWQANYEEQYMVIPKSWLTDAKEFGLDNLNYHYRNMGDPVSHRITDALEFYDSGITAITYWQEMYRYIVSINIVLFGGHEKSKIQTRLAKLIKATAKDIGVIGPPDIFHSPTDGKPSMFERFYKIRSDILHSMDMNLSPEDVDEARHLAFNAIRAMAYISKRENFQTVDDVTTWFDKVRL